MFTFSGEFAQGLNVQGHERQLCLKSVIHFHDTGKLMFAWECLEIEPPTAKECGNLSLKMIHKVNTASKLSSFKNTQVYSVPAYFLLAVLIAFPYVRLNEILTRIWTRELPLSCSGTPEGIRCLCRCFSFFFSSFFFPLRFCLFLVFFLGLSCVVELLGSWMEAVVGHATLLCSEERLKQKYGNGVNSRHDIKQLSIASANEHEV